MSIFKRMKFVIKNLDKILYQEYAYSKFNLRDMPEDAEMFRASNCQKRFYYLQAMDENSVAYTVNGRGAYEGKIDIGIFEKAFNYIVERNEIFRTTFEFTDEGLMQKVNPKLEVKVNVYDLPDTSKEKLEELIEKITIVPYDLAKLPLFRISVIRLPGEKIEIISNFHHIIWDGYSNFSFFSELTRVYNSLIQGKEAALVEKDLDYRHYAHVEGKMLKNGDKEAIKYYREYLKKSENMQFYFTKNKESFSKKSNNFSGLVPKRTLMNIKKRCEELDCSLHDFMFSCFLFLLYKYTKSNHVSSMIPRFSRFNSKILKVYGPMLNALPIIMETHKDVVFSDFVTAVKKQIRTLFKYDKMPFDYILEEIQNEEDVKPFNKIPFLFNYLSQEWYKVDEYEGLKYRKNEFVAMEVDFLMVLYIVGLEKNNDLAISMTYQKDKIDYDVAKIVMDQYKGLVQKLSEDIHKTFKEYPLECVDLPNIPNYLSWPKSESPFTSVMHQFYENALSNPQAKSIITSSQATTYGELADLSANYFDQLNHIEKQDVVIITGVRDKRFYAAMMAVLSARATIYIFDVETDKNTLQATLAQLKPKYCLVADNSDGIHAAYLKDVLSSDVVVFSLGENTKKTSIKGHRLLESIKKIEESDRAYVCSTSGSTGIPKIVQGSHGGLSHFINWQVSHFKITSHDACAQLTNPNFDVVYREIFTPLCAGAQLIVPEKPDFLAEGQFFQWLVDQRVTFFHTVPSILNLVADELSHYRELALSELRWVFSAGEPLHSDLIKKLRKDVHYFPTIVNLYGPTETSLAKAFYVVPATLMEGVQPIGKALPKTEVYILNPAGLPCGMGEVGEISIRPPFTCLGYLDGKNDAFKVNPLTQAEGDLIYSTGDLGYCDEHNLLHIIGRVDDQVKINGIRVELDAIKNAIMSHPSVANAAVVYENNSISAFYTLSKKADEDHKNSIVAHAMNLLPSYMHPNTFLMLEAMPTLASGKINKKALRSMVGEPLEKLPLTLPETSTEKALYEIWQAVLRNDNISTTVSHKNQGLNSLLVIQVVLAIKKRFGIVLKPVEFVKHSTLKELAVVLESRIGSEDNDENMLAIKTMKELQALVPVIPDLKNVRPANAVHHKILLTGATGFVGSYLLRDLMTTYPEAEIFCLIRANDEFDGMKRIQRVFAPMHFNPSEEDWDRLKILRGDIEKPNLGLTDQQFDQLAEEVDCIYHCGAFVNFLYDYDFLKAANVFGTQEIIRLASTKQIKPISYVSTAGIFPPRADYVDRFIAEDFDIDFPDDQKMYGGYAQTKWVAEKMMHIASAKGIPVSIYRVGRVGGDTVTGYWPQSDFIYCFLKTVYDMSSIPELPLKIDLLPVDVVSKMMVTIEKNTPFMNRCYNLINPNRLTLLEVQDLLAEETSKPTIESYSQWRNKIVDSLSTEKPAALSPFAALLPEEATSLPRLQYDRLFSVDNVNESLRDSDVSFTVLDQMLIKKYLKPNE